MLARNINSKEGIVEYLVEGNKQGREQSRDELDQRVTIDGDLAVTDSVLKHLESEKNYRHITLSFRERDIDTDTITKAYESYKDKLMSAYSNDEYNIYAEIHHPKIKSYQDRKTGETVERFSHVHIVIPNKNLVSGKALDPLGKYTDNSKYHDAIQESVNREFKLSSPYDHQRTDIANLSKADMLSRYKGDDWKGANKEVKHQVYDLIHDKNIRSWDQFQQELGALGEVSVGKIGANDEYCKLKLPGASKNIRLKDPFFKREYIENRQLTRDKPTDRQINELVKDWCETKSHEVKHVHTAGPDFRKEYYSASAQEKQELLNERREQFDQRYNIKPERRKNSYQHGIKHTQYNRIQRVTQIRNGLPGMPKRSVANGGGREGRSTEGVLYGHALNHMGARQSSEHNAVRWSGARARYGRVGSTAQQFLNEHKQSQQQKSELDLFRHVRNDLTADSLLSGLEKSHGLIRENYSASRAKDGSYRINVGSRNLNVSDFLTKHMNLSWNESKQILLSSYEKQLEKKIEKREENSIIYVANSIGFNDKRKNETTINESIRIFNYLKNKELFGGKEMSILEEVKRFSLVNKDNNIIDANEDELSVRAAFERERRNREFAEQVRQSKIGDLIPVRDKQREQVKYKDQSSNKVAFIDKGNRICFDKKPEPGHIAHGLAIAAEKYGHVKLTGSKEFKESVLKVAAEKNLKISFKPDSLNEEYQQIKADLVSKTDSIQATQEYKFHVAADQNSSNYRLTVDGKPPSEAISPDHMQKVVGKDEFLKQYSVDEIAKGELPFREIKPESAEFAVNEFGDKVLPSLQRAQEGASEAQEDQDVEQQVETREEKDQPVQQQKGPIL